MAAYVASGMVLKMGHELYYDDTTTDKINEPTFQSLYIAILQVLTWPYFAWCVGVKRTALIFGLGASMCCVVVSMVLGVYLHREAPPEVAKAYSEYLSLPEQKAPISFEARQELAAAIENGMSVSDVYDAKNAIFAACTGEPLYEGQIGKLVYVFPSSVLSLVPAMVDIEMTLHAINESGRQKCGPGLLQQLSEASNDKQRA
ncbi:hypothetical protein BFV93_4789 [Alteromonas macleodii]|nr:hypothetical protein BFV93_4789 [Alteromonas macleodii]